MRAVYLDSSAIVKLVVEEVGSAELRRWMQRRRRTWVSSSLAWVEVRRSVLHLGADVAGQADEVLRRIERFEITDDVVRDAAVLPPSTLRSLDAIHLASALALGADLDVLATYDRRLAEASHAAGLRTVGP